MSTDQIIGIKREIGANERTDDRCYHCGSEFDELIIHAYEHDFCCEGCKTVYEILDENGLHTYYGLESQPGTKVKKSRKNTFAYLDNEEVKSAVLEFSDGGVSSVKFFVSAIHCSSCIWLLENLHRLHPGVVKSTVNFLKKEVYILFKEEKVSLREVVELMDSIGYAPHISLNTNEEKEKKSNKAFFYKLGVAGFAFGNIMLLSFPEYFDTNDYLEDSFKKLFGYLNLFLATPVFLYSASDYYVSAYKAIRKSYFNIDFPITVGIFTLYIRSAYEIITQTGPGFMDSFTMFVFLLLVGKWYQNRTYQALSFERDFKSYFPLAVVKIFKDKEEPIPVNKLEVGDVIRLRNQEIIPADGVLQSDVAEIDYSFVTGESDPIKKVKGDKVYAGGRQLGTNILVQIKKEVSQSYLTRLWNQDAFKKESTGYQSIVNKVSKYFTLFVLLISLGTLIFWWGSGITLAAKVFTSVLIIACPCALALTLPFSFGNAMTAYGRKGFYLKNTETVEKLSGITDIVFDKTGTLTHGGSNEIGFVGNSLSDDEKLAITSLTNQSNHPLSKAITKTVPGSKSMVDEYHEETGAGISGKVNEAFIKVGSSTWVGFTGEEPKDLSSRVFVEIDGEVKGYYLIKKFYRDGLEDLIQQLKGSGYSLHLISGDNSSEMENLSQYFDKSQMRFDQKPNDKLEYIQELQESDKSVLMVGDGLNDAGALKQANVGIAVSDDVYSFTPACDAILDADSFNFLNRFMSFSKSTINIVKMSFTISLTYNTVGMIFAVQGLVTPLFAAILMPLSSITVVTFITLSVRLVWKKRGA